MSTREAARNVGIKHTTARSIILFERKKLSRGTSHLVDSVTAAKKYLQLTVRNLDGNLQSSRAGHLATSCYSDTQKESSGTAAVPKCKRTLMVTIPIPDKPPTPVQTSIVKSSNVF